MQYWCTDGREYAIPLRNPRIRMLIPRRSMKPHEKSEGTFIIYQYAFSRKYLFQKPGKYTLYAAYFPTGIFVQGEEDNAGRMTISLDKVRQADNAVISNPLVITVGPPFPGYEQLEEVGIFDVLMERLPFEILSRRIEKSRLEALIQEANRPWLTTWYAAREKRWGNPMTEEMIRRYRHRLSEEDIKDIEGEGK